MKGKKAFWTGIITGPCIGGLVSLLNKDARAYGKQLFKSTSDTVKYLAKNPEESVLKVKHAVESLNQFVNENASSALNAIEQVENTVNKFKKD